MRPINPQMKYGNTQNGTSCYKKDKSEVNLILETERGLLLGVLAPGQRVLVVSNTVLYLRPDLSSVGARFGQIIPSCPQCPVITESKAFDKWSTSKVKDYFQGMDATDILFDPELISVGI